MNEIITILEELKQENKEIKFKLKEQEKELKEIKSELKEIKTTGEKTYKTLGDLEKEIRILRESALNTILEEVKKVNDAVFVGLDLLSINDSRVKSLIELIKKTYSLLGKNALTLKQNEDRLSEEEKDTLTAELVRVKEDLKEIKEMIKEGVQVLGESMTEQNEEIIDRMGEVYAEAGGAFEQGKTNATGIRFANEHILNLEKRIGELYAVLRRFEDSTRDKLHVVKEVAEYQHDKIFKYN